METGNILQLNSRIVRSRKSKAVAEYFARLLALVLFLQSQSAILQAQGLPYDPDRIFHGAHYELNLKTTTFFGTEFEQVGGYDHHVMTAPDFGYELGFKWKYYINKSVSFETGLDIGNRRVLKFFLNLDSDTIVSSLLDDPDISSESVLSFGGILYDKNLLMLNFALPVHIGYHQYLGRSERHILDYKAGMAVRIHIPMTQEFVSSSLSILDANSNDALLELYRYSYDWYSNRRVTVDLQTYFGYSFIPKNRHVFSLGLQSNLSFEKDHSRTHFFTILKDRTLEGKKKINMKTHYLAIQMGFTFTTKRNTLHQKKKKGKRPQNGYSPEID